ncbi:Aromatic-ring hydroxylase-like protein [Corchorus olitorius]|uniref:squalene monooxygenase n=1 Tax=Corchorus olitorius TaxID=93759 RepID=A0A1R3JBD0_9ROSI|nr:Aromatic-ring hydroxylase-like protein [Corchorus olitorius]
MFPSVLMAYCPYIVGGLIASLLGFALLYYNSLVRKLNKTRASPRVIPMEKCVSENGNCVAAGSTDIIIVGAGVAGAALAYALGKDGRRVHLIERDLNPPDRIAGEGLLPGGYLKLIDLGMEDCVDEIDAQRVLGYVFYKDGKNIKLPYPLEKFESHVSAKCFRNGRFVQSLRNKAASLPNVNLEQGTVTSLLEENGTIKGVNYRNKKGEELTANAPLTIVCDGCFSNLRRSLCYSKADTPSYFVGLVLEKCKVPHEDYAEFILGDPSPFVFYPISNTEIRCLVDVPSQQVPSVSDGQMAHYLKTVIAPQVLPELYTTFISAIEKPNNIKIMPNRTMPASPVPTPGALMMGDAFNMRHPITGGGMTVALSDVVLVRDLLRPLHNLSNASTVCKYLESFYTLRKPMASTINTLANMLHRVFSASSDPAMEDLQHVCFGYFSLGGLFANGLLALLAGICPRPLSMAFHILAMAIYGIGRLLLPFPSPKRIWRAAQLIRVALGIVFPLIKSEGGVHYFMAYYQFIVGGLIASLLGFVFLYYNSLVRKLNKTRSSSRAFPVENCVTKTGNGVATTGTTDIIIVGAGIAGSALAYALGKDGRRVHLIERDLNPPERIAGEALLPGGYLKLIELGMEDCVDEIDAQRFNGYFYYKDGKKVKLSFPLEKFQSHVSGKLFHNGRFVRKLREKAASHPNVNLEQGTVTSLLEENGIIKGVHYKNKKGEKLTANAPLTIVCDGGFSNLRRSLCCSKVDTPSHLVGFVMENCKLPHETYGAIILADPSPFFFYPISSTELRCMVDVPSQNVPSVSNGEMAHYLRTIVAPQVIPELYPAFVSAIEKGNNLRMAPSRTMAASSVPTPGALMMGDAFNMRHPITGGGMTVALSDVVLVRDLLRPLHNLSDASAVCKYLESFYTLRKASRKYTFPH